ncbi:hypothetical protein DL768_010061 [Monosporascus sp. mg162]|nr:hypothetical protein DL768_010061 [Monosporascus sp. mg162]
MLLALSAILHAILAAKVKTSRDSSTSDASPGAVGWLIESESSASAAPCGISPSIFDERQLVSGDASSALNHGATTVSWPSTCYPLTPDDEGPGSEHCAPTENIDLADMVIEGFQAALQVDIAPPGNLPPGLTETLVSIYYSSNEQTFKCFEDQKSLNSYLEQSGYEAVALKYAVCAHAIALPGRSRLLSGNGASTQDHTSMTGVSDGDHAGLFYRLARAALNQSDMGKKSTASLLQTLQATVLIGLYELQQAEINCAWLSVSRAVWLMEELRLYWLDSDQAPSLTDERQLQAARRIFWAASGLSSFLMMVRRHIGIMPVDIDEIMTYLPSNDEFPGLRVADVCHGTVPRLLSVDEGLPAIRVLGTRILMHVSYTGRRRNSNEPAAQAYNFWTHQSRLEESLNYLQTFTEAWRAGSKGHNLDAMLLDVHTKVLSLILGEAKLAKMGSNQSLGFEPGQIHVCADAAHQSALDLAATLQAMDKMLPSDAATDLTVSWAAYVTLHIPCNFLIFNPTLCFPLDASDYFVNRRTGA